jgi:hypothetical protein
MRRLLPFVVAIASATSAQAFPQFQLSRDQTCTACHISPAGGELLNENGLVTAEAMSQLGTKPEFMYDAIPTPGWLVLGGDLRWAAGADGYAQKRWVTFPMQAELYANAAFDAVSIHVTAGARDPQYQNTTATLFDSREHWVQWQQHPDSNAGLYIRAGRFLPVYGLRFAEHPDYTRRYGGEPLYGEAYGVAAEYVDPMWEVHATGFIHDPLFPDSVEHGNGAALYGEVRLATTTAVGVEGKYDKTTDDAKLYTGVTAKQYLDPILLQTELELVHQRVDAGGTSNQLVGYLMASCFVGPLMIDLGVEAYEPDLHVRYLDQEAVDLNVHWFATSHAELLLTNRFQMLELGEGGLSSGYSLLQFHYRL